MILDLRITSSSEKKDHERERVVMSRPKRLMNPRVMNCGAIVSKLRRFHFEDNSKSSDGSDGSPETLLEDAGFTMVEIVTMYSMFTYDTKHDVVPLVRLKGSVPLLIEMFEGAHGFEDLLKIGTERDPTKQTISFEYLVDAMTEMQKSGVRERRSILEAQYKTMHLSAFHFARKVYTMHRDLTKKQLKDFVRGLRAFCKLQWGDRQTRRKRKRAESFSVQSWISSLFTSDDDDHSRRVLDHIHKRAYAQLRDAGITVPRSGECMATSKS